MIVLIHHKEEALNAFDSETQEQILQLPKNVISALKHLGNCFPDRFIAWCDRKHETYFDVTKLKECCIHNSMMVSHNTGKSQWLSSQIGYVEETPFITVAQDVMYPTWQMNSLAGAIHASALNRLHSQVNAKSSFLFYLNTISKRAQLSGLLCYQAPLFTQPIVLDERASISELTRFVDYHYSVAKRLLFIFCLIRFERNYAVLGSLTTLFIKQKSPLKLSRLKFDNTAPSTASSFQVDVIIPTMGRSQYLYDVLKDFAKQTVLPQQIIIVEQNPQEGSQSNLDYIKNESWPFPIVHHFIHQTGACNARNLALSKTTAPWVFFADDDNRFPNDLLERTYDYILRFNATVITTSYLQQNEIKQYNHIRQWSVFGAGNSFVNGDVARNTLFDSALEHGYGEDIAYGYELRKNGCDVLYIPDLEILHLKAQIGGFRSKPIFPWDEDEVQPKPSPSQLVVYLKHKTIENLRAYKIILFIKFYKHQAIKNPLRYYREMNKRWARSMHWAHYLIRQQDED